MATYRERKNADGSTKWEVQVRLKGHPTQTGSFERKTDAKRWAAQTETAIREGRYFPSSESKRHTVADLIDRYTETVLPAKKSARSQAAQFAWWRAELGVLTLKDLTPARISEARDKLAAGTTPRGERRSPATVVRNTSPDPVWWNRAGLASMAYASVVRTLSASAAGRRTVARRAAPTAAVRYFAGSTPQTLAVSTRL